MGPEIKIDIYSVTLEYADKNDTYPKYKELFSHFKNESISNNFHAFIQGFVNSIGSFTNNAKNTKSIKLNNDIAINERKHIITGTFYGGSTGLGGNLHIDNKTTEYNAKAINSKNLFYLIWLHPSSNKGIVFVQGYSSFSAGNDFMFQFQKFIKDKDLNFSLVVNDFAPVSVIEKYLKKGTVKKVRLKKLKVSSDKFDKLDLTYESGDSLSIEVNLTGNVLKRIISKWKIKKKGYFEIPSELQDIGFDGDTSTSITFKDSNGKTTTITSKNNFKASPNFYIPEGVVPRNAIDNLPDLKKLKDYCVGYLNEIKDEIFPVDDDE
ncbi:hypothetical protein [Flavobacterium filum]|uniref:hypothetical protein n=1 Tax=Flavobacterium filum TaxID=370974 RepID=UPI0023F201E2|nr:hypothetical protein [Flavobacterium filum]